MSTYNSLKDLKTFIESKNGKCSPGDFLSLIANGSTIESALATDKFMPVFEGKMTKQAEIFLNGCSRRLFIECHKLPEITYKKREGYEWSLKEMAQNCSDKAMDAEAVKHEIRQQIADKRLVDFPLSIEVSEALLNQDNQSNSENYQAHLDKKIAFKSANEYCKCLGISLATYTKKRKFLQQNKCATKSHMIKMIVKIINRDFASAGRPKNAKNYGQKGIVREIANKTGIPYSTIRYRQERGLDLYAPNKGQNVERVGEAPYNISGINFSNRVEALDFFCRTHASARSLCLSRGISEQDSISFYSKDNSMTCSEQLFIICHSSFEESFIQTGITSGSLSSEVHDLKDDYNSATLLTLPITSEVQKALLPLISQFIKSTSNAYPKAPSRAPSKTGCYDIDANNLADLVVFLGNSWSLLSGKPDCFQRSGTKQECYVHKIVDQLHRISIQQYNQSNQHENLKNTL